jgi:hypothetical protein
MLAGALVAALTALPLRALTDEAAQPEEVIDVYAITVKYSKSKLGAQVETIAREIKSSTDYLAAVLPFPRPIVVKVEDCGVENAFFDPSSGEVSFCYELVRYLTNSVVHVFPENKEARWVAFQSAVIATLTHELAHAFIHYRNLGLDGGEEDIADRLAAYVMTGMGPRFRGGAALGQLMFYLNPDKRRVADLACLEYGADPKAIPNFLQLMGKNLGDEQGLERRAQRCPSEWQRLALYWRDKLRPLTAHTKLRYLTSPSPSAPPG